MLLIFLGAGAAGMYLASETADFPVAMGGNASALGLLCAWAIRDLRDRQSGEDTESVTCSASSRSPWCSA